MQESTGRETWASGITDESVPTSYNLIVPEKDFAKAVLEPGIDLSMYSRLAGGGIVK